MIDKNNIYKIIAEALYEKGIINKELYEKCSKPHISNLPYDLRTNDKEKLSERKEEIEKRIGEITEAIKKNKNGLSLSTSALSHNMERIYNSHIESLLQGMFPNLKINSLVGTQQKEVTDTANTYSELGYINEFQTISKDLLSIYNDTRSLSFIMKNIYETNFINDTLSDSNDIYKSLDLPNQFKSIIASCDNLDKNINQILKNKDFPFKEIKNIPQYSSNIKEDITTVNRIYENYKQGIKINKREEEILSDLNNELTKTNNKLQ